METPYVKRMAVEERELYPCFCGTSSRRPLYSRGPAAKPNYTLQYVLSGEMVCELDGKTYELGPGDGILIKPDEIAYCRAPESEKEAESAADEEGMTDEKKAAGKAAVGKKGAGSRKAAAGESASRGRPVGKKTAAGRNMTAAGKTPKKKKHGRRSMVEAVAEGTAKNATAGTAETAAEEMAEATAEGAFETAAEGMAEAVAEGMIEAEEEETEGTATEAAEPGTYLWLEFAGSAAESYLREIGLSYESPVFHCEDRQAFLRIVKEMQQNGSYTLHDQLHRSALLYECFSLMSGQKEHKYAHGGQEERRYLKGAVEFIQNNYASPIRISEIADYVQINRSYLYILFRDAFSMSPMEYLVNYRLSRAKELLAGTGIPVESVAYSCGYRDPMVFTKAYKAKMGMTPTQYRRRSRQAAKERRKTDGGDKT